ncbi:hypothetical protein [Kitasatospora sp. NBC_01539]|uniref:hypothetical protein n=1 Tax=Kitasatospora sp. NBC_01539 TaxID=2903577 RepID=UPI0038603386
MQGFPGWDVRFEPEEPQADAVPAPRAAPESAPVEAVPAAPAGRRGLWGRRAASGPKGGAADPKAGAAKAAGPKADAVRAPRRPSPLLLFAALALLAGAVTGQLLVMLLGWGAAYLSRRLSDAVRKFVVLGTPLAALGAAAVWYWGRTAGRWGEPLAEGAPMNEALWAAAPGVLRVAAALTALAVLLLTLRRRAAG